MLLSTAPYLYFVDPILRGPTIGSMLMCLAAGLVGAVVFLRKQSLLGEALSHAAYPGVIIGVIIAGALSADASNHTMLAFLIMAGAFVTAVLGMMAIFCMIRYLKVKSDAALCFVLSSFFGIGLTLASQVQFTYSMLYQQIQVYLYGQAATMSDIHIQIYASLAIAIIVCVILFLKELEIIIFDHDYAESLGIPVRFIDGLFLVLIVMAVVIGIRSVGVVLMSAMLIAPAAAARQYTNKLHRMLFLSAVFGMVSGYLGNYFSAEGTNILSDWYPGVRLSLPTGPMIVLVAAAICLFSLFFAPERGMFLRYFRVARFRYQCISENILKAIWRGGEENPIHMADLVQRLGTGSIYMHFLLWRLSRQGWIVRLDRHTYRLTNAGAFRAAKIVRLHRLWEVYLVNYLGVGAERVHRNAEEMEHIITPELERQLTLLLKDPKVDPHHQPIPSIREV